MGRADHNQNSGEHKANAIHSERALCDHCLAIDQHHRAAIPEGSFPVPKGEHQIDLNFIINGETFPVETNIEAPLSSAVEKALSKSHNTGRPISEWEVRDASGALLDISQQVKDLGLKDGARLFLSLRVGAGGS